MHTYKRRRNIEPFSLVLLPRKVPKKTIITHSLPTLSGSLVPRPVLLKLCLLGRYCRCWRTVGEWTRCRYFAIVPSGVKLPYLGLG